MSRGKIIMPIAIVSMLVLILIPLLIFSYRTVRTSGTISLFVDGERVRVDDIVVEFSTIDNRQIDSSRRVRNGCFSFNRSTKGEYFIRFLLNSNMWNGSGEEIHIEMQYFNSQARESKNFEITINIMTGNNVIEVFASDGRAWISSGEVPIDPTYTTVSVHIPSP